MNVRVPSLGILLRNVPNRHSDNTLFAICLPKFLVFESFRGVFGQGLGSLISRVGYRSLIIYCGHSFIDDFCCLNVDRGIDCFSVFNGHRAN